MKRFSQLTEDVLTESGWFQGRNIKNDVLAWEMKLKQDGFELFSIAENILLEFGRIKLEQHKSRKKSKYLPLVLDPTIAFGENDRFTEFSKLLGKRLYPLGEIIDVHYYLAVSNDGGIFSLMSDLLLIGETFDEALENIIKGTGINYLDSDYLNLYFED